MVSEMSALPRAAKVKSTATHAEIIVSGMSNRMSTSRRHASIPTEIGRNYRVSNFVF